MLAVRIRQQQQCKDRFATRNTVLVLYRFEFELLDFLELIHCKIFWRGTSAQLRLQGMLLTLRICLCLQQHEFLGNSYQQVCI